MSSSPQTQSPTLGADAKEPRISDAHTKKDTASPVDRSPAAVAAAAATAIPMVAFSRLMGVRARQDWGLLVLGIICSMAQGAALPGFSSVFGELFNAFYNPDKDYVLENTKKAALTFLGLGVGTFLVAYVSVTCFSIIGNNIARDLRIRFFKSVCRQEMGFFDENDTGSLTNRLSADIQAVQNGCSEKVGQAIMHMSALVGGIIVAFVYGWKLTLVLLGTAPVVAIGGMLQMRFLTKAAATGSAGGQTAATKAQEVIHGISTVVSFNQQDTELEKYRQSVDIVKTAGVRNAHLSGIGFGSSQFIMFGVYALGFWFGGWLVANKEMEPGSVLTTFFAVVIGSLSLGQAAQVMPDIAKARAAGFHVFAVIDRVPKIDYNPSGVRPENGLRGDIQLDNITFAYPARPDVTVLHGLSMHILPGQKVALVGPSGSGKSSVIRLLERFYDVTDGSLTIDGVSIKDYNLEALRSHIGLVSQEPVLFNGTVMENILYGRPSASKAEVEEAARRANAHDFIAELSEGYHTLVGEGGTQLSGGQKQRVAIARAILKNPSVLLLDEATSALDSESEYLVQEALNRLMSGRTSVVIAHRLSTVQDADCLFVIRKGRLAEQGTHQQLVERGGIYATLVQKQMRYAGNVSSGALLADADDGGESPEVVA